MSATDGRVFAAEPAPPIGVTHSISIRNGNWIPLPAEELRRAAGDAALSRLTDAGRLSLLDSDAHGADLANTGSLALEIALIGPAETAKLTITLNVQGSPTLVSTASISVHGLDHAGIYDALEHVGERAADRLAAKLDLLQNTRRADGAGPEIPKDDPARRQTYDQAQAAKREGNYNEARILFETVVASSPGPNDTLRQLAEDELRYGLPLFEAQQAYNVLGRMSLPGQQGKREEALSRAENLFRQIQAENPSNVQRVTEAQRALDNLIVVRGALANAMRASMLTRLHSLRIAMMEYSMMEGGCPDRERMRELMSQMNVRVSLGKTVSEGDRAMRYSLSDSDSRTRVDLLCSDDGIEIVESVGRSSPSPASFR
jgi:tetratricopeptide (TPR) repeat protein